MSWPQVGWSVTLTDLRSWSSHQHHSLAPPMSFPGDLEPWIRSSRAAFSQPLLIPSEASTCSWAKGKSRDEGSEEHLDEISGSAVIETEPQIKNAEAEEVRTKTMFQHFEPVLKSYWSDFVVGVDSPRWSVILIILSQPSVFSGSDNPPRSGFKVSLCWTIQ